MALIGYGNYSRQNGHEELPEFSCGENITHIFQFEIKIEILKIHEYFQVGR